MAVLLQLVFFHMLMAAGPGLPLGRLGIEQGLSNNSVRCIYQDHNGFMWFGTYDGLNRYDGYECKVFRNKLNDSTSLPHNYIYAINEDRHNNLWVGTGQGIGVYNNLTASFQPKYYLPAVSRSVEKIAANITAIETDARGNVFMGTNGWGLLVQEEGAATAVQLTCTIAGRETTDFNVQAIKMDKQQNLWLFIDHLGLCRYDYATKKIRLVNTLLQSVSCMEVDGEQNFWFGTSKGLFKFNIASNTLVKSYYETAGGLSANTIASLFADKQGQLWIGTEGGGVNILNLQTGVFDHILPGTDKTALSSESVFSIYGDSDGRKWMGTLKGGINIIDPQKDLFRTIDHDPLNRQSLVNNFVSCFFESNDNTCWIGTDGGGLSIWNRSTNSFTSFRHEPGNAASLSNNLVTSIRQDYTGAMWIATYGGGINRFNSRSQSFEHFTCINDKTGEENKNAWLLFEDSDKELWATTFGSGKLYRFNRQQNRFMVFDPSLLDLIAMVQDKAGSIWAGNSHQLIKIDKHHLKHAAYEIGKPVRALYEDHAGRFWIGTEGGGLLLFNRQQGKIEKRYSDANGLSNNSVLNILEDNNGHLWLSTFNGLSQFYPAKNNFKNFYQSDGLQSNQFLYNAAIRFQSGELAFGGVKGFNIFNPDSLLLESHVPAIIITGLRINNTAVRAGNDYISKIAGDKISALRIPYYDAVLSFDFAALEYSSPDKITYAYFLENWDKAWNYAGSVRTANYSHLKEGDYILHIKAANTPLLGENNEVTVRITVLPPWFRSWWAYILYGGIVCAGVYIVHTYRKRQERLKYQVEVEKIKTANERERAEKESLIARQQTELAHNQQMIADNEKQIAENEKEIAAKEREINEKRASFFTNIAHEFRSPLTLIINPVEDMLKKDMTDEDTVDLKIIERNSKRLLSLVNQLLLFRKAETEADKLKISRIDLAELCREVYFSFTHEARTKRIDYTLAGTADPVIIYADREKTEIILYNLISNAIKYTPHGKTVLVAVTDAEDNATVLVKDTGYGFTKETGDRIFDKFYRAEGADIASKPGFGIGLYLVKNFTALQHGNLSYQSHPGEGSSFEVSFVKSAVHFNPAEIIAADQKPAPASPSIATPAADHQQMVQPALLNALITDKRTMLVMDDDEELRRYTLDIFKDDFITYEANNGITGVELAKRYVPDIIVSDIMMPGMTGIEACAIIKADPALAHIPVLLLTGTQSEESQLKGAEGGADDYLTKPFAKELLVARVNTLLKNRSQLQQYFYDEVTQKLKSSKISPEEKVFLEKCIAAIEARTEDDQFNIEMLASDLNMSHSNLYKNIKAITGFTVNGFIRFVRLRKAARLFIDTDLNISQVAFRIGIPDVKYFRENFSKQFGMNPSDFIRKYRKIFTKGFQINKR